MPRMERRLLPAPFRTRLSALTLLPQMRQFRAHCDGLRPAPSPDEIYIPSAIAAESGRHGHHR